MKFSAYCKCTHVAGDANAWRVHVKGCKTLQEAAEQGAVEIRYPDLAPLRPGESEVLQQHGFTTWQLPRYARVDEKKFQIDEEPYGETLPLYVVRAKTEEVVKGRALDKIAKDSEAQKALVALLQCTDTNEHAEAISEFANHM